LSNFRKAALGTVKMTTGFDYGVLHHRRDSPDRRPYGPVLENTTMITRMSWLIRYIGPFLLAGLIPGIILGVEQGQFGTPKSSEGTRIFKADEHPGVRSKDLGTRRADVLQESKYVDHSHRKFKRRSRLGGFIAMKRETGDSPHCLNCESTLSPKSAIHVGNGVTVQPYECLTCCRQWYAVNTGRRIILTSPRVSRV
jgi:hypothetical protein